MGAKQKGVTRPDHASLSRAALNSAATQTPKAHRMVGGCMMMDRKQLGIHEVIPIFWWDETIPIFWWDSGGIIPSGQGVVK